MRSGTTFHESLSRMFEGVPKHVKENPEALLERGRRCLGVVNCFGLRAPRGKIRSARTLRAGEDLTNSLTAERLMD